MKIVCISDTHSLTPLSEIPDGDILIVAGDFCNTGSVSDVMKFSLFLRKMPHKYKIVVAGNHDVLFEKNPNLARSVLGDCIYLEGKEITIEGIKIYGAPWTPEFRNWAFNVRDSLELRKKWSNIPEDTDVLVTHGPPFGILDQISPDKEHLGCEELLYAVEKIQPSFHIFGHIHGGYGAFDKKWSNDKKTTFINASICNERYELVNEPQVISIINEEKRNHDNANGSESPPR